MVNISEYPQETLARWWCQFNRFEWPEDFPYPEPPSWHSLTNRERHYDARGRNAWAAINAVVDKDLALKLWREQHPLPEELS
jgi:hypothetical protein